MLKQVGFALSSVNSRVKHVHGFHEYHAQLVHTKLIHVQNTIRLIHIYHLYASSYQLYASLVYVFNDDSAKMKQFQIGNGLKGIDTPSLNNFNCLSSKDISPEPFITECNCLMLFTLCVFVLFLFLLDDRCNCVGYSSFLTNWAQIIIIVLTYYQLYINLTVGF